MKKPTIVLLAIAATVASIAAIQPFSSAEAETKPKIVRPKAPDFIGQTYEWFNEHPDKMKEAWTFCSALAATYNVSELANTNPPYVGSRGFCGKNVKFSYLKYCGDQTKLIYSNKKSDPWCSPQAIDQRAEESKRMREVNGVDW